MGHPTPNPRATPPLTPSHPRGLCLVGQGFLRLMQSQRFVPGEAGRY